MKSDYEITLEDACSDMKYLAERIHEMAKILVCRTGEVTVEKLLDELDDLESSLDEAFNAAKALRDYREDWG